MFTSRRRIGWAGWAWMVVGGPLLAQPVETPRHVLDYPLYSGVHTGQGTEPTGVFSHRIHVEAAAWLQVHFGDWNLGRHSFITLVSLQDGGFQRLDGHSLPVWNSASAIFNGDAVELRLYVAPGDEGVFVSVRQLTVGDWVPLPVWPLTEGKPTPEPLSLCGSDNRVASTDNRVGRLFFGGCTAWHVSNGAFLTAGHCVDFDPDKGGPLLPDGVLDLSGVVEFNVPPSTAGGFTVAASPDDQYPIITSNVQWRNDGEGQGLGKDWAVFAVGPNSNTGLRPHEAYGVFFRMTRESPANGATTRITGFGGDTTPAGSGGGGNAQNFTNQTSTGSYVGETTNGANIFHEYQVDTEGGNSGSPIIWEATNVAMGIHTNAGCDNSGGGNYGTSFEVNALETALRAFTGAVVRFADAAHPIVPAEDGSIFRPYNTVAEAVSALPSGGVVSVVRGTYSKAAGNVFIAGSDGKSMRIEAPVGSVVIGN